MDVSKTYSKYKHYTCLCFSVMGQRRFRISVGATSDWPEAGDASTNVSQTKKCSMTPDTESSKSFFMLEKDTNGKPAFLLASHSTSTNNTDEELHSRMLFVQHDIQSQISDPSLQLDNCQFPYYRSSKGSGNLPDAVLVKDVGVSCTLLNENANKSTVSGMESYLVKQLKIEYKDLSNITRNISAYTKDILSHLSLPARRKARIRNSDATKRARAFEYSDIKGNPYLKLRLLTDTGTQCSLHPIFNKSENTCLQQKCTAKYNQSETTDKDNYQLRNTSMEDNLIIHHEKQVQTVFSKRRIKSSFNSLSNSGSSVYNFLMAAERNPSNDATKFIAINPERDLKGDGNCKNQGNSNEGNKEDLQKGTPVIFTNWKEISRSRKIMEGTPLCSSFVYTPLKEQFINHRSKHKLHDTKFHTVNIRIVKHHRR